MSDATITVAVNADTTQLATGLAKGAAMVAKFDKQLAQAGSGKTSGQQLPGLDLNPKTLGNLEKAAARSGLLARKTQEVGAASRNGSMGFLAFSQAVEDSQYGLNGVLNNIPQMIIGFGGSMGLAGAISLVAVAAYTAYKAFKELSGINEMNEWAATQTKATETFTAALQKAQAETAKLAAATETDNRLQSFQGQQEITISKAVGVDEAKYKAMEQQAAAAQRARSIQDSLIAAAGDPALSKETGQQQGTREWENARLKYATEQKRLTEDLARAQESLNTVLSDYQKIWNNIGTTTSGYQAQKNPIIGAAEELRQKIGTLEAELSRAKQYAESARDGTSAKVVAERDVARIETEIAARKDLLDAKKKEIAVIDELIAKTRQEGDASKTTLDAKKEGYQQQIEAARAALKAQGQRARMEADTIKFEALKANEAPLQTTADHTAENQRTVEQMVKEIDLLQEATTQGGKKLQQVQEELEIRQKIAELVKQGVPVNDAETLVRQLDAAQKAAEKARQIPQGTVRERQQARTDENAARRTREREERISEVAAKRAERLAEREKKRDERFPKKDQGLKPEDERKRIQEETRKKAEQADKDLKSNIKEQTDIQKAIKTFLTEKLAAA